MVPSIISDGLPTPCITFEIRECSGFIVVTTFNSALIGEVNINNSEKNKTFIKFFL